MAEQSSSLSEKNREKGKRLRSGFDAINVDILDNILSRVPALAFASAACVSRSWNDACNRILSRPKLASALSLNFSAHAAIEEVLDKVLSEPIRPHFAIANVRRAEMCSKKVMRMLSKRLGSKTPVIVSYADGLIGRDVNGDEFKEVKLEEMYGNGYGIVLTVGFVPGLKVDAIPLLKPAMDCEVAMVDQFVTDIQDYAVSVSGCKSPVGIILFGEVLAYQKQVLEMLDYSMSAETAIVGDARSTHVYRSATDSRNIVRSSEAVALVFAKDKDKATGVGEIEFHVAVSNGLSEVGPRHKAVSVVNKYHATWLTAKREGDQEILDGERILDNINEELENYVGSPDPFIGVTKRRKCLIGSEKGKFITSLAFHGLHGGDQEYLFIEGSGIRTLDYFQFYLSDPNIALSSCKKVSENLQNLKLNSKSESSHQSTGTRIENDNNKEVFGGLIFACYGRGECFFGNTGVDSSPFLENFPGLPFGGVYCGSEIGRPTSSIIAQDDQVRNQPRCCLHVYSTVYLVMSFTPAAPQH